MKWNNLFMNLVYLVAAKSKDESTHVGAVIVDSQNRIVSCGYNGMPRGTLDMIPEKQERPQKYFWMVHAELNSILNAARSVEGCRMYTNGVPCAECAKAIIQSGIRKVIVDEDWEKRSKELWGDKWEKSQEVTRRMFREADVNLVETSFEKVSIHKYMRGEKF